MYRTGLVRDPFFRQHMEGMGLEAHPENSQRLVAVDGRIDRMPMVRRLIHVPLRAATVEELAYNHDPGHIAKLAATAGAPRTQLDPDTVGSEKSYEVALAAVGSGIDLVDRVRAGRLDNGFALVRPPGHHATPQRSMGFCWFNNIAIAAHHLRRRGIERVAIVDFDVHHGNGTQDSFYSDPNVLFLSSHQYPFYPGTGGMDEVGTGDGTGYTVNLPLPAGSTNEDLILLYREVALPILDQFKPQFLLVSAGYDGHGDDPIGGLRLSRQGYDRLLRMLMEVSNRHCESRIVLFLEGGYNLHALAECVSSHLELLFNPESQTMAGFRAAPPSTASDSAQRLLRRAIQTFKPYWPALAS